MTNPFVPSMAGNFEPALRLREAALEDCPDDLWEMDSCPDDAPTGPSPSGGSPGSAPWILCCHALSILDHDRTAEFEPWAPPQPVDENTHSCPDRMFTRGVEILNPECDDSAVARRAGGGGQEEAVLDGGPMDGNRQAVDAGTDQLRVVMGDGQQHRYLRTEEVRAEQHGHRVLVFRWNGRYFGPK